ncbi:MAG TPA: hypothetical protein VL286_01535 [Rhizomicrobium sp.]|jgi:hypothetical protein|nr:hypothetical protein [Rhizomicrobium sp.]
MMNRSSIAPVRPLHLDADAQHHCERNCSRNDSDRDQECRDPSREGHTHTNDAEENLARPAPSDAQRRGDQRRYQQPHRVEPARGMAQQRQHPRIPGEHKGKYEKYKERAHAKARRG